MCFIQTRLQFTMKKFLPLFALLLAALSTALGASELSTQLKNENYVLLMRHANAPGVGDPPGYSLERCASQRLLDEQGKAQSVRIGKWLRNQGITNANVYSSPWCRCTETAKLLDLGPVAIESSLASFFDTPQLAQSTNQSLQQFIAKALSVPNRQALVLVTHHVNVREFMGSNIGSGDMVLAKVDAQGRVLNARVIASP